MTVPWKRDYTESNPQLRGFVQRWGASYGDGSAMYRWGVINTVTGRILVQDNARRTISEAFLEAEWLTRILRELVILDVEPVAKGIAQRAAVAP